VVEAAGKGSPSASLDEIAEIERAGKFFQGMGLLESSLREDAGDLGGAVIAAYKELSWVYGYGGAGKADLEEGLRKVLALYGDTAGEAVQAARGALAFVAGRWTEAEELLGPLAREEDPDAFSRWLLLVCALEGGDQSRLVRSAYGSIRARYENFPEYWYRGARAFTGAIAAEYAERCINLNPGGPFAEECRGIITLGMGLSRADGAALKSRAEIEDAVSRAAAAGQPEILVELFPLIALPDNAYTLYALGALRALAGVSPFKEFFAERSARAGGRLAERLAYVSRG
jgi:hypothetical protein